MASEVQLEQRSAEHPVASAVFVHSMPCLGFQESRYGHCTLLRSGS